MRMRAVELHETGVPEVLRVVDREVPAPRPGEVLVRVEAAGVNFGETMQRAGTYPIPVELPMVPGSEVAGTVAAVGPGVSEVREGERVVALLLRADGTWASGGYAEYAVAPVERVVSLPAGVAAAAATALLSQGLTAYFLLKSAASLAAGQSVLVHAAAGGVGSLAVQLARLFGAGTVLGTAGSEEKRTLVRQLGAKAVDYTKETWPASVREATDGRGVDLVLDSVGGDETRRGLDCLAPSGRVILYGALSGRMPLLTDADWARLIFGNQGITGFASMAYVADAVRTRQALEELLGYAVAGQLTLTTTSFALERAAEAHRAMEERRTTGKLVLTTGEATGAASR